MVQHRRIFSIFVAVVMPIVTSILPMYGQNYIKKETYLNESGTEKITDIQYFDGLGRPTLTASNGVGTSGKYVYKLLTYDNIGRDSREYLPVVGSTTASELSESSIQLTGYTYYGDSYAYMQSVTLGSDPAVSGAPYMTASIEGAHSTYRTGGLANFINNKLLAKPLGEGLTLGTNMYVRQGMNDIGTMNHEGYHVNQQMDMGWASFYGNLAQDYLSNGFGKGPLEDGAYRFETDNGNLFVW